MGIPEEVTPERTGFTRCGPEAAADQKGMTTMAATKATKPAKKASPKKAVKKATSAKKK